MTEQVSPLRQRMIDDMAIRNMSPNTQKAYVSAMKNFSKYFGKSPDKLTFEDVRSCQLHLVSRGLQAATIIPIMCAIRFFYGTTIGQANVAEHIPLGRKADTLPAILTRDQVVRFLKAVPGLEMRTLFITSYSAGLRVSEAVALTARDIDSANMVIHVRQDKGCALERHNERKSFACSRRRNIAPTSRISKIIKSDLGAEYPVARF
jgi:site-specific recombinase XerD